MPSTSSSPTPPDPVTDAADPVTDAADPVTDAADPVGPTRRGKWILAGIALALVVIVGGITAAVVLSSDDSGSTSGTALRANSAGVGKPAPDFELTTLDGKSVKLSDYKGKPVVLNFWASWCTPCRKEFPEFRDALAKADGKWSLVGVNTQDLIESDGKKFAKDQRASWPNGFDADGAVAKGYGVKELPQTFFIDAKGVVRAHLFGGLDAETLQQQLAKIGA